MSNWFFTFGVVQLSPLALDRIGWEVYIIYAIFNAAIALLVYLYFPETAVRFSSRLSITRHFFDVVSFDKFCRTAPWKNWTYFSVAIIKSMTPRYITRGRQQMHCGNWRLSNNDRIKMLYLDESLLQLQQAERVDPCSSTIL